MKLKKIAAVIGAICITQTSAMAINNSEAYWSAWGYGGQENVQGFGSVGELILDGCLGKSCRKSSFSNAQKDEGAIVLVVAEQITEHGGLFCPYQFQCRNERKNKWSWSEYFQPTGFNRSKCAWLCEKGYSGVGCVKQYHVYENNADVVSNLKSGISMNTTGKYMTNYEQNIAGFKTWDRYWYAGKYDDHGENDVVLGVVQFLKNGVIASPVQISCKWDDWKDVVSWVDAASLATSTGKKLLCKEGYIPNETNTDCIQATAEMLDGINPVYCSNYPADSYNVSLHRMVKNEELGCWMYFCRDTSKAFATADDVTNCTDCASSVRGGPSERDGTCVVCNQVGQYFDGKECKQAAAYSTTDLQYGKGKTKSSDGNINNQCWVYTTPDEYAKCVKAGKNFKASNGVAPGRTE